MSRLAYQRAMVTGRVLNVGSGENPAELYGVHLDRMRYPLCGMVLGDACALPFKRKSFDSVVLGDCLEHIPFPSLALQEAVRVARQRIILTIPMDDRLPPGQHIAEAMALDADRLHPTINFFSEAWLRDLIQPLPVVILDWSFVPEHDWSNWLITLEIL